MLEFDARNDYKELDKNMKLQGVISDLQDNIKEVVIDYRDVFLEEEFLWPIHRFQF